MFGNPETTTGGRALKFYASVRLDIRRIASLKDGEEVIGSRAKVKVVKNKVAAPFRQAEFDIEYGEGISKTGELIDLGVEHKLVIKSGAWYTYGDVRLGQGRENAKQFLRDNPDLADEIETQAAREDGHPGDGALDRARHRRGLTPAAGPQPGGLERPPPLPHHRAVGRGERPDQGVAPTGPRARLRSAEEGDRQRDQPHRHGEERRLDALAGVEDLEGGELERGALAVGVEVEEREDAEDGDEPRPVDLHEERRLAPLDHRLQPAGRRDHESGSARELVDEQAEEELERVDVEEDDEQKDGVEGDRDDVLEAVAAEVEVLLVPHPDEDGEADPEGDEAAHVGEELVEGARHLERDDE